LTVNQKKFLLFEYRKKKKKFLVEERILQRDPDKPPNIFDQVSIKFDNKQFFLNNISNSLIINYKEQKIYISKNNLFINNLIPEVRITASMTTRSCNTDEGHIFFLATHARWRIGSNSIILRLEDLALTIETIKFR
jgi:hypothetical protein